MAELVRLSNDLSAMAAKVFAEEYAASLRKGDVEVTAALFAEGSDIARRRRIEAALLAAKHDQIEGLARAVEVALPVLSERPSSPDPIHSLALRAQRAWAVANDGDYPRGTNPKNPLVKFVTAALAEIGMAYSAETVSAVLRGLRRTERRDISGH